MTRLATRHVAHLARPFNALAPVLSKGPTMPKHITPRRRPKAAPVTPQPDHRAILARRLEVLADCELQHGHVAAAERLSWRAMALREGAR